MRYFLYVITATLFLFYACQAPSIDPEKTKEEISPKARLDEKGYTKKHLSNKAVTQMQDLADQLCSGEMGLKEIMDFEMDGHSLKFFLEQDISTFKGNDLKAYSDAREKAKCCLKAITENQDCSYMK